LCLCLRRNGFALLFLALFALFTGLVQRIQNRAHGLGIPLFIPIGSDLSDLSDLSNLSGASGASGAF